MVVIIHGDLQFYENKKIFNNYRVKVKDDSTWLLDIHYQN